LSWSATNLSTKELFIKPYEGGRGGMKRKEKEEGGMRNDDDRGGKRRKEEEGNGDQSVERDSPAKHNTKVLSF
jgi:hypothetical protein